jgi:hypothetical protein
MLIAILYGIYQQPTQWRVWFDAIAIFIFFFLINFFVTYTAIRSMLYQFVPFVAVVLAVHIVALTHGLLRLLLFHIFPFSPFNHYCQLAVFSC